jgi:AP2-like factor (ANT lineage)
MAMEMFDFDDDFALDFQHKVEDKMVTRHRAQKQKDFDVAAKKMKVINPKCATRTSRWKGVTKHKITSKWEAHLWDADFVRRKHPDDQMTSRRRGRQVYLGGYADEESAARAYDLASLRYFGPRCSLNFPPIDNYKAEMKSMYEYSREAWVAELRRQSSGFSRGRSAFRGVTSHSKGKNSQGKGKWEARIGRVMGNRYLYLGTFSTEREAAEAYDCAALHFRTTKAVTNFDRSNYSPDQIANAGVGAKLS